MKKYVLLLSSTILLGGCQSSPERKSTDEGIQEMIKDLQDTNAPAGNCETRPIYKDDIKLPYHIFVCKDQGDTI